MTFISDWGNKMEELLLGLSSEPMTDEEYEDSIRIENDEFPIELVDFTKKTMTQFDF